jgi:RNA polymerase sigma-70 factor (ECF subfamily)
MSDQRDHGPRQFQTTMRIHPAWAVTTTAQEVVDDEADELAARFALDVASLRDQLRGAARRYAVQPADAEDLVQETLMRAWRAYGTFEAESNFRAWLHRIMINTWISRFRTAQRRPSEQLVADHFDESFTQTQCPTDNPVLESLLTQEVRKAMRSLPEAQRIVVYYAYVEGRRHKDIAAITGIPVGTVMSRLHRARHHLRDALGSIANENGYGVVDIASRIEGAA